MQDSRTAIKRALVSGTVAGLGVVAAAALAGKRENGSSVAPLNATSHIVWGNRAALQDRPSLKYTLTGLLLNQASAIMWATVYEKLFGGDAPRGKSLTLRPLVGGALVSAGAYVTDYHLVPKRLTPGFEMRLSGKSLATIYVALALGLAACDLAARNANPAAPERLIE